MPSKARLYLDFDSDEESLPDFLTSEAVRLDRLYVETSIIATPLPDDEPIPEDTGTVDIPIT